jgi:hypothetical protein
MVTFTNVNIDGWILVEKSEVARVDKKEKIANPKAKETVPVKRHRTHTGHTRVDTRHDTRAHKGHTDHTDERRTSQPSKPTNNTQPARQRDDRSRGRLNSRRPGADRSPRPTQKRPPPANPTLPPPVPRGPPRACSKAVGEMKARAADA